MEKSGGLQSSRFHNLADNGSRDHAGDAQNKFGTFHNPVTSVHQPSRVSVISNTVRHSLVLLDYNGIGLTSTMKSHNIYSVRLRNTSHLL
jgi:hypothetical protein